MLTAALSRPFPAAPLRWTRLLVGLAGLVLGIDALDVLGDATGGALRMQTFDFLPRLGESAVLPVVGAWLVLALLLTLGKAARPAAAALALLAGGVIVLEQQAYSNHWLLFISLCALLVFALPRHGRTTVPYAAVFLLQVQVTTLYFWTGVAKINAEYFDRTPLRWNTREIVAGLIPRPGWILLSVLVVAVEIGLAVALWLPRTRRYAIAVGVLLHVSLGAFGEPALQLLPFQFATLSVYPLFAAMAGRSVPSRAPAVAAAAA